MSELPKDIAASKRWRSGYWHKWYGGLDLSDDLDHDEHDDVLEAVQSVVGVDGVDADSPLMEAGIDSLGAVELRDNGRTSNIAPGLSEGGWQVDSWHYYAGLCDKFEGSLIPAEMPNMHNYMISRAMIRLT